MKSIYLGSYEIAVADLIAEQKLQALTLEIQLAGLREYLATRHELISWLESEEAEG
jgi:hypothetical protein